MPTSNFNLRFSCLLILLIFCVSSYLSAQIREIDSLKVLLNSTESESDQAKLHCTLAERLYSYNFEQGLPHALEAQKLAEQIGDQETLANALTLIGTYYYYKGETNTSLDFYNQALEAVSKKGGEDFPAKTYLRLSILFRSQASFDSAELYLKEAEALIHNNNQSLMASFWASRGLLATARYKNKEAVADLKKSLSIRTQRRDLSRTADTWRALGGVFTDMSQYDSAKYCYQQAEKLANKINDPEVLMLLSLYKGQTNFVLGEFNEATENYEKAMSLINENLYKRYYAVLLFKIGELYENQGAYNTAHEYLFNALTQFEKLNARQDMGKVYAQIGWCYNYQENFPMALDNAQIALKMAILVKDSASISQNQNLIGFTYYKMKRYDQALFYFKQAVEIRKRIEHWWGVSFTLHNMALTCIDLGRRDEAMNLLQESLSIDQRIGKKAGIIFNSNELGYLYAQMGDFNKANFYLSQANKLAKSIPIPPQLLLNYKNYIFLSEKRNNTAEAIKYYRLYASLKDSLTSEAGAGKISKADALFQLQKKATQIDLVNKEIELHQEHIKLQQVEISFQRWVIIIISVGLILVTVLVIIVYRLFVLNRRAKEILRTQNYEIIEQKEEIQAQSEELSESNDKLQSLVEQVNEKNHEIVTQTERIQEVNDALEKVNDQLEKRVEERTIKLHAAYNELETFFYRTSHDFRRPLTTYLGLADLAKSTIGDSQALYLFEKVKETTLGLDAMLYKLQSISSIEANSNTKDEFDLRQLVDEACSRFKKLIESRNIKLLIEVGSMFISSHRSLIYIALENIIENGIVFSGGEIPTLKISADKTDHSLTLFIEDNGEGIPDEVQPKIFDMYFRGSDSSRGNGLGLFVAKRAIEKIQGEIIFRSFQNMGSLFVIKVPLV